MCIVMEIARGGTASKPKPLQESMHLKQESMSLHESMSLKYEPASEQGKYFCIVMEIALGGTASKMIKDKSFVRSEELIRSTIKQVIRSTIKQGAN